MLGGMHSLVPAEPKAPKMKKPKPEYTEEEMAELERLFKDRTSPGRKAYKRYQLQLRMKYAQTEAT